MEILDLVEDESILYVTINRPKQRNSINKELLDMLFQAMDYAIETPSISVVVFQGTAGFFCTGMELEKVADSSMAGDESSLTQRYMDFLELISTAKVATIAVVDGTVLAGGVGIVAACDYAIGTKRAKFSLSEALWGLLPCMVLPFLSRKIGFNKAKIMTMTTLPIDGEEAFKAGLLDTLTDDPESELSHFCARLIKIDRETIAKIKTYFEHINPISKEIKEYAVETTTSLFQSEKVIKNISDFVNYKIFPWENRRE